MLRPHAVERLVFHPRPALPPTSLGAAALNGLALSLGLIVAIGAQNAFVLRQGLQRAHVGPVVLACVAADALLMAAGVAGLAGLIGEHPGLARALAAAGMVFLLAYGLRALWAARRPGALQAGQTASLSRRQALWQLAGFTLLNPHVYLDTVLLVGSVGAQQPGWAARGPSWPGRPAPARCGSPPWATAPAGWPRCSPARAPGRPWTP
jgi:arginine exporter protein ArgO